MEARQRELGGAGAAADFGVRLEHLHREALLGQLDGGRQPIRTRTDHDRVEFGFHGLSRTKSADTIEDQGFR